MGFVYVVFGINETDFGVLTFLSQAFYKAVHLTREILNLNLGTLIQSKDGIFLVFSLRSNWKFLGVSILRLAFEMLLDAGWLKTGKLTMKKREKRKTITKKPYIWWVCFFSFLQEKTITFSKPSPSPPQPKKKNHK